VARELFSSVSEANLVALCTCQQSKDFPFCDNTHMIFNKATNSNLSPLYVAFVDGRKCGECDSKLNEKNGLTCSTDNLTTPNSNKSSGYTITLSDRTNTHKSNKHTKPDETFTNTCQCTDKPTTITSRHTNDTSTPIYTKNTNDTNTYTYNTNDVHNDKDLHYSDATHTHRDKDESPVNIAQNNSGTCNITEVSKTIEATYKPSSIKDPINQKNIITKAEVSEHNTKEDLWMIIKGNVYDITNYVRSHPGGVRALVNFAGKDGTDNVQYHSPKMLEILNTQYFIGRLPKEEGGDSGSSCIIC